MARAVLIEPDNVLMRYNFACVLTAQLSDGDAALAMLHPVLQRTGLSLVNHAKIDPDLDPIRNDPRFTAMIAEAEARLSTPGKPPSQ